MSPDQRDNDQPQYDRVGSPTHLNWTPPKLNSIPELVEAESRDNLLFCATSLRFTFCNPAGWGHSATLQTPRSACGQPDVYTITTCTTRYTRLCRRLPQKIWSLWLSLNPQHFPLRGPKDAFREERYRARAGAAMRHARTKLHARCTCPHTL